MVQASVPVNDADRPATAWSGGAEVSCRDLMVSFMRIGLLGFGGVAPVARHELIERRGWLNDREYAALLGLGKVLPGANTVNAAVMIGDRFQGPKGALLSVCALMAAPLVIVVLLALAYQHFAANPFARGAIGGAAAAAAGLVIGTAAKMARGLRPTLVAAMIALITLVGVGLFKAPLLLWLLLFAPVALLATRLWGARR
jgi:chromate transporter